MKLSKLFVFVFIFICLVSFVSATDACCERTNSGDYCQYTDENECSSAFRKNYATCEQTSYCNLGCCFSQDEGRCFKNTPQALCKESGGTFSADASCSVSQCTNGCCLIGTEAFFVTEVKCKETGSKYSDITTTFDSSITDEKTCLAKSKSKETGCCVSGDSCIFTTRDSCSAGEGSNESTEGFFKDMLCSNDMLSCGCAKQHHTECYQGKVYWYDSCGNRENVYTSNKDVSYNQGYVKDINCKAESDDTNCGNCDYVSGTICGNYTTKKPAYGEFICKDVNCKETTKFDAAPSSGKSRNVGESWCIYEGAVGEGLDLVGSRHYRALCINGEEMIEECKDYREEMCVQQIQGEEPTGLLESINIEKGYIEAGCVPNRYSDCGTCNNPSVLRNMYSGKCSGVEDPVPDDAGTLVQIEGTENINEAQILCSAKECCNDINTRDCYWSENSGSIFGFLSDDEIETNLNGDEETIYEKWLKGANGKCVPNVPPGMKFWSVDYTKQNENGNVSVDSESKTGCSIGSQTCKVEWVRGGLARVVGFISGKDTAYECVKNCQCTEDEWVVAGNNYCKSLGDCGAYFNVNGVATFDGYVNTASAEKKSDSLYFDGYDLKQSDLGNINALVSGSSNRETVSEFSKRWDLDNWIALGFQSVTTIWGGIRSGDIGETALGGLNPLQVFGGYSAFGTALNYKELQSLTKEILGKDMATTGIESNYKYATDLLIKDKKDELLKKGYTIVDGQIVKEDTWGNILGGLNTFFTYYQLVQLFDVAASEYQEKEYTINCQMWQAPEGGDDCEKCNDEKLGCSEYKCKSLGKTCSLINAGTAEEKCVDMNPKDVDSPIIEPSIKDKTIKIKKEATGFEIENALPAYSPVDIGIKTNEPSQCKFNVEQGKDFDEMVSYFQDELLRYDHQSVLNLPGELKEETALRFSNGGKYTVYVRCKDAKGNKNERDYYIRFKISSGPDLTAPIIRGSSPIDNAYIASDVEDMPF
ncbi:MAG: hypothetical protein PHT54_01785, partial [Candidatus Nanoarchaeia archaeon]|nr:hypothetical protein [Candidatus Nanoarchaeia archaeon]